MISKSPLKQCSYWQVNVNVSRSQIILSNVGFKAMPGTRSRLSARDRLAGGRPDSPRTRVHVCMFASQKFPF